MSYIACLILLQKMSVTNIFCKIIKEPIFFTYRFALKNIKLLTFI